VIYLSTSERYSIPLPEGHTFPMEKYSLVQQQLLHEGVIEAAQLLHPELLTEAEVLTTHSASYWHKIQNCSFEPEEIRKIGFPPSEALRDRSLSSASGTLLSGRHALKTGLGINLAGGTHHAFHHYGEGYCVLNDIAIAINCLRAENQIKKALIVDLDVHQGNGTAALFQNDTAVFTFSMHCRDNYPLRKELSDLDVELPAYTGDETYLGLLGKHLPELIHMTRPDIIFYQSGVDVIQGDRLGKLALTPEGCKQRDAFVFQIARQRDIPIVSVMGGGYHQNLHTLISAHTETVKQAIHFFS
jgi:acetoin utilization deacetylase AcuC-like enzyme